MESNKKICQKNYLISLIRFIIVYRDKRLPNYKCSEGAERIDQN